MNFKVIFRKLANYRTGQGRKHFSVQLRPKIPGEPPTPQERALAQLQLNYLYSQFNTIDVKVFWGTCSEFATEVRKHL